MGLFLLFRSKNSIAFVICSLIGLFFATFLPQGNWAIYTSMLVSYHLFLGWLVVSAEHETGFSLPVVSTAFTHLCCLIVIVSVPTVRHIIPFFSLVRIGVISLAIFERDWLFRSSGKSSALEDAPVMSVSADSMLGVVPASFAPISEAVIARTEPLFAISEPVVARSEPVSSPIPENAPSAAGDHEAWLSYLANRKPSDMKRGLSLKDEYAQWMQARTKARVAGAQTAIVAGNAAADSVKSTSLHPAESGLPSTSPIPEEG